MLWRVASFASVFPTLLLGRLQMFGPPNMDYCSNEAVLHMSYLQVHPGIQVTQFRILLLGLFCVGSEVKLFP